MSRYKQLLTYIKSAVTRNHSEKSINSILDYISTSKQVELLCAYGELKLIARFGLFPDGVTAGLLRNNPRCSEGRQKRQALVQNQFQAGEALLWPRGLHKAGQDPQTTAFFMPGNSSGNRSQSQALSIKKLPCSSQTDDGEDDLKKGTQLLEIYALEIQMYTAQKNNKKLKALYEQSLHIKSAIPHPLIMGVIRECGGKMHLREGEFEKAHTDFFEAFKNYDESGSPRRTTCLKYLVLANM